MFKPFPPQFFGSQSSALGSAAKTSPRFNKEEMRRRKKKEKDPLDCSKILGFILFDEENTREEEEGEEGLEEWGS